MTHRIKQQTVHDSHRGAKKLGECSVCGETAVVWVGLSWRCLKGEKEKTSSLNEAERQRRKRKAARISDRKRVARSVKATKTKLQHEAEALWRLIVFERAGRRCEICGKGPFERGDFRLQAHHAVKRSQSARLRLDPQNGIALDSGCHLFADRDPIGCLAKVERIDSGLTEYLFAERRVMGRRPFEEEIRRLFSSAEMNGITGWQLKEEFPNLHKVVYGVPE